MDYKVYLLNMLFGNTERYTITVQRYTSKRYLSEPGTIDWFKMYDYVSYDVYLNRTSLQTFLCELDQKWLKDSSYGCIRIDYPNNKLTRFFKESWVQNY